MFPGVAARAKGPARGSERDASWFDETSVWSLEPDSRRTFMKDP